jgi:hypothetical protein
VEKRKFFTLAGLDLRPLGRPARSQSPYRLRYPGSFTVEIYSGNLFEDSSTLLNARRMREVSFTIQSLYPSRKTTLLPMPVADRMDHSEEENSRHLRDFNPGLAVPSQSH